MTHEAQTRRLRRPRTRRLAGLTLVEVMIALAILAVGLLAMLAMQIQAMTGGKRGRHSSTAALIAQRQMETFHRLAWIDAAIQDTGGWVMGADTVTSDVQGAAYGTEQTYNVDWRIQDHPTNNLLREIDVRVTWYEPKDPPPPAAPRHRYAVSGFRYNGAAP